MDKVQLGKGFGKGCERNEIKGGREEMNIEITKTTTVDLVKELTAIKDIEYQRSIKPDDRSYKMYNKIWDLITLLKDAKKSEVKVK